MRKIDLTGKRFNNLTVIEEVEKSRSGRVTWLCKCDCGNTCYLTSHHLTRTKGAVKSCGCLQITTGSKHVQWKGHGDISGNFWSSRIQRSEKKRAKIECSITIEYAWELFLKQDRKCALTGLPLKFPTSGSDRSGNISMDRIDSSKGYIEGNVQWVHKDINKMKNSYSQEYFIKMCKLVARGSDE